MRRLNELFYIIGQFVLFFLKIFELPVLYNSSKLAGHLRKKLYKTDCYIDTNVIITNPANFLALEESALYHGCYILNSEGQFLLGRKSHLGAYCYVNVLKGEIRIGDNVAIGPGTKLFVYTNHYEKGTKVTDVHLARNIEIGNNVFIGSNCSILPGTIIKDNVIIGAGSVVKGEFKSNAIYAGVPCHLLQQDWYE